MSYGGRAYSEEAVLMAMLTSDSNPRSVFVGIAGLTLAGSALLAGCQQLTQQVEEVISGGPPDPEEQIAELALLPADIPMFFSLVAQPQVYVDRAPALFRAELSASLDDFYAELLETDGEEAEEIAAWIGDTLTFAVFDLDVSEDSDETPSLVVATTTQDPALSSAFVQRIWAEMEADGVEFERTETDGVILTVQTDAPVGELVITAEIGEQYIAVGNDPAAMEQIIAVYRQDNGLSNSESFQTTLALVEAEDPLLWGYVNPAIYGDEEFLASLEELEVPTDLLTEDYLATLEGMRAVVLTAGWDPQALQMQVLVDVDPEVVPLEEAQLAAGELIKRIPSSALMAITSTGPAAAWQQSIESAQAMDPEFEQALAEIRAEIMSETGLDLDKDIIGWMDGEIAITVLPDPEGTNPFLYGQGAIIAIETSQRDTAEATFAKLDQLAQENGLRVSESEDQVIWGDPFLGQAMLVRAWDQDTVLLTSSAALQTVFGSGEGVTQAGTLQELYNRLPEENAGYFMLNLAGILSTVEQLVPPEMMAMADVDAETLAKLRALGGLGIAAYLADDTHVGMNVLLTFQEPAPAASN